MTDSIPTTDDSTVVTTYQGVGKVNSLKERLIRLSPSWFTVTMGTGIVNNLLFTLPWTNPHLVFRIIGACFLVLDVFLFIGLAIGSVLRYTLYPKIFPVMLFNETHSLFLGCIPMGFVTIVTGIASLGNDFNISGGLTPVLVASGLWWFAVAISCLTAFGVPYVMFTKHAQSVERFTAAWLLPVVAPITVAASGSTISRFLISYNYHSYALTIIIASFILDGIGVILAFFILTNYFQRLVLLHLPAREVIITTFLPLGPCGQGGFALIELGRNSMKLFPLLAASNPDNEAYAALGQIGAVFYGSALLTGLLLWGLGIWWFFHAVVTVLTHYLTFEMAFNMGAWGVTFPIGSMALLTFSLGASFDSLFFKVIGAGMTLAVFILWWLVAIPTARGFFAGTLFDAPCLSKLPLDYLQPPPKRPTTEKVQV